MGGNGPGRGSVGQRWWVQYRWRMDTGLETCRGPECDTTTGLTFDHIHPRAAGGSLRFDNATILCGSCQLAKADSTEPPWCDLPSLAAEEATAAPEHRWSRQRVPDEVAHRLRAIRRRTNRAAAAAVVPWRNEHWTAQLAQRWREEESG